MSGGHVRSKFLILNSWQCQSALAHTVRRTDRPAPAPRHTRSHASHGALHAESSMGRFKQG
eukprot:211469-Chlamydomonas_euryale.AAC.4